ncbi:hypothetical protein P8452_20625 [Trifolium repens]|nr:hypothetical protein P8452_20625 [Trifolium repens]
MKHIYVVSQTSWIELALISTGRKSSRSSSSDTRNSNEVRQENCIQQIRAPLQTAIPRLRAKVPRFTS